MKHIAYISIGSNLGEREANIRLAISKIEKSKNISVKCISNFYETKPLLKSDSINEQNDYINAAMCIVTNFNPEDLLNAMQAIESDMGRPIPRKTGESRTIDLDILLYDNAIINSCRLIIPHPEMQKRMFVLKPLCDIAAALVHPKYKVSIHDMMLALKEREKQ